MWHSAWQAFIHAVRWVLLPAPLFRPRNQSSRSFSVSPKDIGLKNSRCQVQSFAPGEHSEELNVFATQLIVKIRLWGWISWPVSITKSCLYFVYIIPEKQTKISPLGVWLYVMYSSQLKEERENYQITLVSHGAQESRCIPERLKKRKSLGNLPQASVGICSLQTGFSIYTALWWQPHTGVTL
jgi:hypothetical protein